MFMNKRVTISAALLILLAAMPLLALEGSANFTLMSPALCGGTEIKAGQYTVKYASSSPEVTVSFIVNGKVVAKVEGKIQETQKKSEFNSLLIGKDASGRQVISGMLFSGKKIQINF